MRTILMSVMILAALWQVSCAVEPEEKASLTARELREVVSAALTREAKASGTDREAARQDLYDLYVQVGRYADVSVRNVQLAKIGDRLAKRIREAVSDVLAREANATGSERDVLTQQLHEMFKRLNQYSILSERNELQRKIHVRLAQRLRDNVSAAMTREATATGPELDAATRQLNDLLVQIGHFPNLADRKELQTKIHARLAKARDRIRHDTEIGKASGADAQARVDVAVLAPTVPPTVSASPHESVSDQSSEHNDELQDRRSLATGPIMPKLENAEPERRSGSLFDCDTNQFGLGGRATVEEYYKLLVEQLFRATGRRDEPRRKSFDPEEWNGVERLVRVERPAIPILGTRGWSGSTIELVGVADAGEIFALVSTENVVALVNPLGQHPDESGVWYQVRLLEGEPGWICAVPRGLEASPFARAFEVRNGELVELRRAEPQVQRAPRTSAEELFKTIGIVIGVVIAICFLLGVIAEAGGAGGGSGGGGGGESYSSNSSSHSSENEAEAYWPYRGAEIIVGYRNIYTEGCFSDTKVGHLEKNDTVHRDGFFSSEQIGKVERSFWGTPTAITDNDGNKVGDIKDTLWSGKIIVDKNGNKIGEYKGA